MEWISVKDQLPEDQLPVLLSGKIPLYNEDWIIIGYYFKPSKSFKYRDIDEGIGGVAYWTPLPKPPKQQ